MGRRGNRQQRASNAGPGWPDVLGSPGAGQATWGSWRATGGRRIDTAALRTGRRFGPSEPRERVRRYVSGLIAGLERRNGWTLAGYADEVSPGGMQRLLRRADSDVDAVRDDGCSAGGGAFCCGEVSPHLGDGKGRGRAGGEHCDGFVWYLRGGGAECSSRRRRAGRPPWGVLQPA
jgi:hypothetical protein